MGFKVDIVFNGLSVAAKSNTKNKYIGALKNTFFMPSKNEDLLNFTYKATSLRINKADILTKYCSKKGFNAKDIINQFDCAPLDEISKEQLLKLVDNDRISLYTTPNKKKFVFLMNRNANDGIQMGEAKGVLNYINGEQPNAKEAAESLKTLLSLEKEGKISAENITELLKLHPAGYSKECNEFISMLKKGEIEDKNISQALLMIENGIPLEVFNPKNLIKYSKENLHDFALVLQASRKKLPPELLGNISKQLSALVKVNNVSKEVIHDFITNFEHKMNVFENSKHSIDELVKAGGIKLEYPRQNFKENILSAIKNLPDEKQNEILSKFGLNKKDENILSGLPVFIENNRNLNSTEKIINEEIKKFLKENKIISPKGYEEYQTSLESICQTFPEFMFTVGSKQHQGHSKYLAEHMLMAVQENMKNPLYKTLSSSDKKVLGISTLLHDLNKIECSKDALHPLTSSESVNSIVQRMGDLTTTERNRIINLVENHHWLTKIRDMNSVDSNIVSDLAFKFRHSNDFKMAKIFAESDLKSVNDSFFSIYGNKLNSETVKAVEKEIEKLHSKGRLVFTADITLDKAIKSGAKETILGQGSNSTKNWIIKARDLGLDNDNIIYHASDDAGLICVAGNCGYGKELVLSASLGRIDHCATFNKYPEFIGFRQVDMSNIGSAFIRNTKYGKSYDKIKYYSFNDSNFASKVQNQCNISCEQYAGTFKEISGNNIKISNISNNQNIQRILGGEVKAKEFETAVTNVNKELESTMENYGEVVIMDPELGFIGTKRGAKQISYELRKFCQDNNILIVDFT